MSQELQEVKADIVMLRNELQELKLEAVRVQGRLEALKTALAEQERDLNAVSSSKVSLVAFSPVQKITYGIVSVVLIAFLTSIISLVIPAVGASQPNRGSLPAEVHKHEAQKNVRKPASEVPAP